MNGISSEDKVWSAGFSLRNVRQLWARFWGNFATSVTRWGAWPAEAGTPSLRRVLKCGLRSRGARGPSGWVALAVVLWGAGFIRADHETVVLGDPPYRAETEQDRAGERVIARQSVPAGGFEVNPARREEARAFFNTVFRASEGVPIGWTGNFDPGDAGNTSPAFREAVRLRVNYFRAMAGVPSAIAFSVEYNRKAQEAAFMMSANNQLNHFPPETWKFYTADGAEAARNANLSIGNNGWEAVTSQMRDNGASNEAVGHRRWILYPQTRFMGTGDVPRTGTNNSANVLWVIDSFGTARPAVRDEFVAWPPNGFVPYTVVYPRWSFAYPQADFSATTVVMTRNGTNVPVDVRPVSRGFGENTLVWIPDNLSPIGSATLARPEHDTTTQVTIANVLISGAARTFTYSVTVFDPDQPGADTVLPVLTGPDTVAVGQESAFDFNSVPVASGYQWRQTWRVPFAGAEGAENGIDQVTADVSTGYAVIATDVKATGAASFHLANPDFRDQRLDWERTFLPGAGAQLRFSSRLARATTSQVARVQVSTDGKVSWTNVFNQAGTSSTGEGSFVSRFVDLGPFSGKPVQVRFLLDDTGGSIFTSTTSGFGWYLDDISLVGAEELIDESITPVSSGTRFTFNAASPGNYALQVRAGVYGQFHLEWGPVKLVAAEAGRLQFSAPRRLPDGTVQLRFLAGAGDLYGIQTSADLRQWQDWTEVVGTGTQMELTDPTAAGVGRRFYRAMKR